MTHVDAPTAPAPRQPCRVLVVDDSADSGDSLAAVIGLLGHDARVAYDGLAAVQVADEYKPHLVLMDLTLPVLSGYEAASRIRALPTGSGIMLVALTGWGRAEDERRTAEAGFHRHVVKPLDFDLLKQLLAEAHASAAD
jgi:CheY-like chemotaxis protein